MFMKIRDFARREEGLSEAATAIFVLPIIVGLLFLLVETGFNIRTRSSIDALLQDTVRSAALDGGYNNVRATTLPQTYTRMANPNSGWSAVGTERLRAACNNGTIRSVGGNCNNVRVTCTPAVAPTPGVEVSCSLSGNGISYLTVSPLSTNPLFSFGFAGLFTTPIDPTFVARAAIGQNG
jgi:Flp pilus assembly protein TadG